MGGGQIGQHWPMGGGRGLSQSGLAQRTSRQSSVGGSAGGQTGQHSPSGIRLAVTGQLRTGQMTSGHSKEALAAVRKQAAAKMASNDSILHSGSRGGKL